MRVLKLTLQYDGTAYVGWQRQKNGVSIQALVEDALAAIVGAPVTVVGAGRTDAGVHALGQVASVRFAHGIETAALARALNARLPGDVRIVGIEEAAPDFHARFAARSKTYRYRMVSAPLTPPFERHYSWHVPYVLDFAAMAAAARSLEGRHDFAAFQSTGSATAHTARTITQLTLLRYGLERSWFDPGRDVANVARAGALIEVELTGDGFLRHMVRSIVGTLVEVGAGRRPPEWVAAVLESRDRARAGRTAPAHGLFLVRVTY